MYLSQQIDDVLESNRHKFIGNLSYATIIRRLGISFDFPKDLKFRFEKFKDVDVDEFYSCIDNTNDDEDVSVTQQRIVEMKRRWEKQQQQKQLASRNKNKKNSIRIAKRHYIKFY